ncbi:MAG: hypothetical protein HOP11_09260 [Saprospiraceae bacterium]|nr:hypothetical protein [Saprospiraceae bacterium]
MKLLQTGARISSILFHPIFYLVVNLYLLIALKPHWFGVNHWSEKTFLIILVFIYSILIPGIAILMLKVLGVIKTLEMKDKYERIFPLIICMIFYLWLWINLKQDQKLPQYWIVFILCSVITTGLGLIVNNWIKMSIHTAGITATLLFWIIFIFQFCDDRNCFFTLGKSTNMNLSSVYFLMILTIISGWVITSRLLLSQHNIKEVSMGIVIGVAGVLAAIKIVI